MVEQWNSHGGTVWWNRRTVMVEQCGGKVEQCGQISAASEPALAPTVVGLWCMSSYHGG